MIYRIHRVVHILELGAQAAFGIRCRGCSLGLLAQRIQLLHKLVGLPPGAFHDALCLGMGFFQFLLLSSLRLLHLLACLLPGVLCRNTRVLGVRQFLLQLLAAILQPRYHIFHSAVFRRYQFACAVHHVIRHAQATGNSKRVGAPGHTHQQPVGGAQRSNIKFAAAVFHTGGVNGVFF